jgi:CO/xanthine dehydrogenase Mo-binding subunit
MTDYIVPTSADIPPIRVLFDEQPYSGGPAGAKGIGELPMDGPAPAILNAIRDAIGLRLDRIPATPEAIFDAMVATHATDARGMMGSAGRGTETSDG